MSKKKKAVVETPAAEVAVGEYLGPVIVEAIEAAVEKQLEPVRETVRVAGRALALMARARRRRRSA